jgi:hypothetical protein
VGLTAVAGIPGIGKSALAAELCRDPAVQAAFPDGIVWLRIGREAAEDRTPLVQLALETLGAPDPTLTQDNCLAVYRSAVADKRLLVVLDDVWRARDVEQFRTGSPTARLLYTTRDLSIAGFVGAQSHNADLLEPSEAQALFARWSGRSLPLSPVAEELVGQCKRLALTLALVGARVAGKPESYLQSTLELLRSSKIDRLRSEFPNAEYRTLFEAVDLSVQALDEPERERYLALAVLLEDMPAHQAMLRCLWGGDAAEVQEIAWALADRSLVQWAGEPGGAFVLHDVLLDYLRCRFEDAEALRLVHGALRLSAHVLARDPAQFAPQMVGRLLPQRQRPQVAVLVEKWRRNAPRPWIELVHPALDAPGGALVRTLAGHGGVVHAVAVTPDGRRAVSGSPTEG